MSKSNNFEVKNGKEVTRRDFLKAGGAVIASAFFLNSITACAIRTLESANGYIAVIPSVLQAGMLQSISIALFRDSKPVNGQVELVLSSNEKEVLNVKNIIYGKGKILFTVPPIPEGEYTVSVQGDTFIDKTSVKVENKNLVFVETDKPIYKPGQDIRMRVFTLNADLLPVSEDVTIEVLDNKGIKIFRSIVRTNDYGTNTLNLPISTEPNLGVWKISASTREGNSQLDIRVEEYVLPKYEVNVELPRDWYLVSESIKGQVTAAYSFGKPVQGKLEIHAWRYTGKWEEYYTFTASIDGKADFNIPAAGYVAGVPGAGGNGNVKLEVTLTENSTGYKETTSELLTVSASSINIQVIPSGVVFKPGLPFSFLVITQTPDNTLVDSKVDVNLFYYNKDFKNIGSDKKTVSTVKGKALVEITPPTDSIALTINSSAQGTSASKTIEAGYSPSSNFIHLEQISEGTPNIGEELRFKVFSTQEARTFYYEVISRGKVVFTDFTNSSEIVFQITPQMGPSARLLVYQILANSEVAADYLPFDVTANYPQDVQVSFSKPEAEPGSNVNINIQTDGQAAVGIVAVDKSVFILTENRLNLQQVFDKLEQLYMTPQAELHEVSIYDGISTRGAKEIFKDAGVIVLSNNKIPEGQEYQQNAVLDGRGGILFGAAGAQEKGIVPSAVTTTATMTSAPQNNQTSGQNLADVTRIRQYFPETWLWEEVVTDSSGKAAVKVTVPDSITTWMLRTVAVSKTQGLGVAESQMVAFQPFFVSVDLPYSAIRGEEFPVKVAVYNYLEQAQTVQVEIQNDKWFELLDQSQKTISIKANDIGGVWFNIKPKQLGNLDIKITARSNQTADAIIKTLLIEAEGVSQEIVDNLVISAGSKVALTTIPSVAIDGSGRAFFTVTSSYLTQTMDGLEKLIQMPFGCGEQNMIVFAPDVFITRYLKASGQLKPEIMAKAEKLMITGYQRELTYRRSDGSFSAFGQSDKDGSIWLTAFVLKSFVQAKNIIYIDDSVLTSAKNWIISHQNTDGSFDIVGFVHHQEMVGGLKNKTALTAYITTALLQSEEKTASAKAVKYLENQISSIEDSYTMALTAYTLELAQSTKNGEAYQKLMNMAKEDQNGLHWGDEIDPQPVTTKAGIAAPEVISPVRNKVAGIETTAYATMTLTLHKDNLNAGKASKWLVSQRNAYGGYGSTQDTVVALEALTLYATGSRADINLTVNVSANGKIIKELKLDSTNYDVLQMVDLPVNEEVAVNVQGNGEAIGQIVRRFNLPEVNQQDQGDIIKIKVDYDTTDVEVDDLVTITVDLTFNPPVNMEAGMTVVDISVPTGFAAVGDSIATVPKQVNTIKRYDIAGRKVIFYIDNLIPGDHLKFSFDVRALYPVKAKGVVSQAYSYYQPEISTEVLGQDVTVH
jgi:CD109 antigen